MKEVLKIVSKLKDLKTNDSIKLLQENRENEKLLSVLDFVFNPYVVTGISTKKFDKKVNTVGLKYKHVKFASFIELLNYIKENNTGTDEVILNIQNYCKDKPNNIKEFIKEVVTKKLKIGLDVKGINKACKGFYTDSEGNKYFLENFIPTFDVQLAYNYYECKDELLIHKPAFTLTLKLDGQRCVAVKHNGKVTLHSRSGKLIEGCFEIENDLNNLRYDDYVLDGEILAKTEETISSKERYTRTMEIMRTNGLKSGLEFIVFDCITYNSFSLKRDYISYLQRRNTLANILSECKRFSCVSYLPNYYCGNDYTVINGILEGVVNNGLEGLMLNINNAPYSFERTQNLLKIKLMQDTELKVLEVKVGTGKYANTLGAIICKYQGNTVNVGSGFSNFQRDYYWKKPNEIIGKMVTVQYFEETHDANGKLSLRFPVFKDIREAE